MTGVEAVSNGVTAFKEPRSKRANQTLTVIIFVLIILLFGLSYVARAYGVTAMDPDASNYQSVLSIEVAAVFGRQWFYFLTMGSVLAALSFSANTAFADFPRMARAIAMKDYLPHVFLLRGRRLLFSHGIYALTGFTALILILFDGVTDRLIRPGDHGYLSISRPLNLRYAGVRPGGVAIATMVSCVEKDMGLGAADWGLAGPGHLNPSP